VQARGEIGDADPLTALDDAVRLVEPLELMTATHPPARSHWLERGIVSRARERYGLPITHLVVDLDAEPGDAAQGAGPRSGDLTGAPCARPPPPGGGRRPGGPPGPGRPRDARAGARPARR